ncbi:MULTISPECIES: MFS transporter [unclassified Carboxylicivirga]|uniref:MFS transporter n=1 Tax=Carboxylicivirga TaxID=1628153 RepID=UPI003D35184D
MNLNFYKKKPALEVNPSESEFQQRKRYKRLRWQTFLAATIGYSFYYVSRTGLNVVKKPILESGILDTKQLGYIGSALLFTYAIGKFVNSFLADHSNIRRFMATGLIVSACANLIVGILGLMNSNIGSTTNLFLMSFILLWGINGWSQSMGAGPSIVSLSRWFPKKERGTYYGFFSASHNFGEFLSFIFVGLIVSLVGWQWGFVSAALAGAVGVIVIVFFMHDSPESKALPSLEKLSNEREEKKTEVSKTQIEVLKNPYVWVLAFSSAFMYISRYAINGWGVLFLQEHKGFSLEMATRIISINALLGIIGTIVSGWFSDKLFKGSRNVPALIFGVLNTVSLSLFLLSGDSLWINVLSMVLFGIAIGVLICFLGGLMAIDIVPRNASGAALGIVGIASYIGAGIQDVISGYLIDKHKTYSGMLNGVEQYDYNFTTVGMFWIGASIVSFVLAVLVWNAKQKVKEQ